MEVFENKSCYFVFCFSFHCLHTSRFRPSHSKSNGDDRGLPASFSLVALPSLPRRCGERLTPAVVAVTPATKTTFS